MFRRMLQRFSDGMRRFMWGRCGVDQLNVFLLCASVVLCILGFVLSLMGRLAAFIGAVLNVLAYVLLFWYEFRMLSRNLERRALENRRYLIWKSRITDGRNRYFRCPNCKQTVRVPRGRGKICIKCPKCGEKFIKKT